MRYFLPVLLIALAGCASDTTRVPVSEPTVQGKVQIAVTSVEIGEISLPSYAAAEEITIQAANGTLTSDPGVLWADDPARAISLELTRHLSSLTGARIAPAPWPFESLPQAVLDIRFEQLLPRADGRLVAVGQYFVGRLDEGRERSGSFSFSVPIDGGVTPQSASQARGRAIAQLAALLARDALR